MLIIFQGKEQKIGFFMAFIGFILMLIFLSYDFHFGQEEAKSLEKIRIDRIINTAGASLMCLLEVLFVVRVGASIQHLLVDRSERLNHSNRRLTSLVQSRESMMSILSHDLRSPLTLIVSTLDLIRPGRIPMEQLEGLVEKVSNRTRGTLLLLDTLLLWARGHSENTAFEKESVQLKDTRQSLLLYCDLLSSEKKINFDIRIPEDGEVLANQAMLDTILRNLVSNAFKFTPSGGHIVVQTERKEKILVFRVEDTGRGMSPESLQHLRNGIAFSMEGTDREKGHGLGIQIVRDFIQKLDASIEVHSEPGKGTQFVFTLPQE
jgi:signal transduction histidine kinase